jgi:hypothetical protein
MAELAKLELQIETRLCDLRGWERGAGLGRVTAI